ncbi:Bax inhibitor-1/YccA family protein [Nocardioides bigeumensis]|uniref:Bax inhibitor-1/YccA family protein n=1 Tax=Nocardioides bigeumensis TaxID=433657 RepID=A0ABP5K9X6_9ACTN
MQSNNPIFTRSPEFNGQGQGSAAGGYASPQNPYGSDPSTWGTGTPGTTQEYGGPSAPMTIDSVVQKSAISIALVFVFAALTWYLTPEVTSETAGSLYGALLIGSGAAFALSLVNSFKRVISPALVMAFAAAEGVALGALSKFFDATFVSDQGITGNIVMQAVVGTFAAFAGTLAAYKFFDIQVGQKFRTFVIAAMFGMVALGLLEMVLGLFGNAIGFFGFGALGLLFSVAGLALGIFMLILDFDMIERGIAARLPERESWRAAFGLTVSLVWIYTNLLRILAILRGD